MVAELSYLNFVTFTKVSVISRCVALTQEDRPCRGKIIQGQQLAWMDPEVQLCRQHMKAFIASMNSELRRMAVEIEKETLDRIERNRKFDTSECVVYYMRRRDMCIKIGYTTNLKARLRSIEKDNGPINILATHRGGRDVESEMHYKFKGSRIGRTEWFLETPELIAHIDNIQQRRERNGTGIIGLPGVI